MHERELMQAEQILWDKVEELIKRSNCNPEELKTALSGLEKIECLREKAGGTSGAGGWMARGTYGARYMADRDPYVMARDGGYRGAEEYRGADNYRNADGMMQELDRMRGEARSPEAREMVERMRSMLAR